MTHKYLIEDARIEPFVTLIANDNWLEFTARYVVDYKKRRVTKDHLFTRILEELDNTEIELASNTIELVAAPSFCIKLESRSYEKETNLQYDKPIEQLK